MTATPPSPTDTPEQRAARLAEGYYNSDDRGAGNPGGLGDDGHVDNLPALLADVGVVAQHVGELAADTAAAAATVADAAAEVLAARGVTVDARDAAVAAAAGLNMPSVTAGDAGKALVVNASGTGFVTGTANVSGLFADVASVILPATLSTSHGGQWVICAAAGVLTLPAGAGTGWTVLVHNASGGVVAVNPPAGETVDGVGTVGTPPAAATLLVKGSGGWRSLILATQPRYPCWSTNDTQPDVLFTNGNLSITHTGPSNVYRSVRATHPLTGGKYYFEVRRDSGSGCLFGISRPGGAWNDGQGISADGFGLYIDGNVSTNNGATVYQSYTGVISIGAVVGLAVDCINHKLYYSINGVWQSGANPVAGTGGLSIGSGTWFPAASLHRNPNPAMVTGRFLSGDLGFTPPAGYAPLG